MAFEVVNFTGPPRATDMVAGWDFAPLPARGRSVRLTASYHAAIGCHEYAEPVARLVGEACAAAVLLMGALRFAGRLTFQLQSEGPVRLLLVQCDEHFAFRALARYGNSLPPPLVAPGARLAITLEPADCGERYQGLVEAGQATLAATLENYFRQSEQLPTRVHLASDSTSAGGMLLQSVPERADPAIWRRLRQSFEAVTDADLLTLDPVALARRRFCRETVRVYERGPAFFRCSCSRERAWRLVGALGESEVADIVAKEGAVDITCEFCGRRYRFDAESALAAASQA